MPPLRRTLTVLLAATLGGCSPAEQPSQGDTGTGGTDPSTTDPDPTSTTSGDPGTDTEPDPSGPPQQSSLPVEVLGRPEVETVEYGLAIELDGALVDPQLELTLHNVVASGATQLELEGVTWDLGDPELPFLRPQGGVASGSVPLTGMALEAGEVLLVFRYTAQVPDVSGYRVLAAAIVSGDARYEPDLPQEDPSQWEGPSDGPEALVRGEEFFTLISRDGGPVCAACHADSGADLQYFGVSNRSIVSRAMFHEFPQDEAEDIATYIRSLDVPRPGRIYNPVFQPGSVAQGAAGAGLDAILADDDAFGQAFGPLPDPIPWDWPAGVDTYTLPTEVQLPGWFRWMPRLIDDTWFERDDGALAVAMEALRNDPSEANAVALQNVAVEMGLQLLFEDDVAGRVELLRLVAVKLWDWSRVRGFEAADHGVPDWGVPYPYEVGFAFFEAADAGALPIAWPQTYEWWWAQFALNPGRGLSDGSRPINYADLLRAADSAGAGPQALAFLQLYGSWEESRGPLAVEFGTELGPVRLLDTPMSRIEDPQLRFALWQRYIAEVAVFAGGGGTLSTGFHSAFSSAWSVGCAGLSAQQVQSLRDLAPAVLQADMQGCS